MRPIIPKWNENSTALLWWRGTYSTAQRYEAAIVGIIENKKEEISKMNYVDASGANTTFADGTTLVTTGPDASAGAGDSQWHKRTGFGNGGSVFTTSEVSGENAPAIKTNISLPKEGTFDIWVNFWGKSAADWRIKAGLSQNNMQVFREMACKQVETGNHDSAITLSGNDNTSLYQAYVGRVAVSSNKTIEIFVDDESATGRNNSLTGDIARTWYDGISYAAVNKVTVGVAGNENLPTGYNLRQNYSNPFNPSTIISYQLPKSGFVSIKVYDVLGREISTLVNEFKQAGSYHSVFNILNSALASGVYFYTLNVDNNFVQTKKMMLIK